MRSSKGPLCLCVAVGGHSGFADEHQLVWIVYYSQITRLGLRSTGLGTLSTVTEIYITYSIFSGYGLHARFPVSVVGDAVNFEFYATVTLS